MSAHARQPAAGGETGDYAAQRLVEAGDWGLFGIEVYDIGLLLAGLIVLIAALVPRLIAERHMITAPILFLAFGAAVFLLPFDWRLPDLVEDAWWPKRLTELGVIIALTAVGLKLNEPFAWKTWRVSWRLLAFTMPLTIALCAWLGWWFLGFAPAAALLLGAVIAPTDPVLATDVQTTRPGQADESRTRVALSTEAGLNDGLAFPFTNLAIAVAVAGLAPAGWLAGWIAVDVVYKIAMGALVGGLSGWLLAKLVFGIPRTGEFSRTMTGILAISLTLVPYGIAELVSSYGFIAVFIAACMFRQAERDHDYQAVLHDFSEELERILVALLMFLIGAYAVSGALAVLDWRMILAVLAIVFLIRPLSGLVALPGCDLPRPKRWAVSFYGIRGIGSIYYLAYAIHHADFAEAREIWAVVLLVVIVSVVIHGLSAARVMERLDARRRKMEE